MTEKDVRLGELLVRKGWIGKEKLQEALEKQKTSREFLGAILLREKWISEEQLAVALSEQFGMPHVRLKNFYVDWNLAMKFSTSTILDHQCFPLRENSDTVTFGITNPLDAWVRSQVEAEVRGQNVRFVLVTSSDMLDLISRYQQYVNIRIRRSLGKQE